MKDFEDILNFFFFRYPKNLKCIKSIFIQIQYKCVPGFELTGKDTVYCQSDGTWTPSELPTCIPVQCPIPNGITNGKALYTAVAYKSVVNYECSYGFMVIGDRTRTCGEDKQWSGDTPTCVVICNK